MQPSLLLALVFVASLMPGASAAQGLPTARPPTPIEVRHDAYGISFTLPDTDWQVEFGSKDMGSRPLITASLTGTTLQFELAYSHFTDPSVDMDRTIKSSLAMIPGAMIWRQNEKIPLADGVTALSTFMRDPDLLRIGRALKFSWKGKGYSLLFFGEEKDFSGREKILTDILKSFRFFTPAGKGVTIHHQGLGAALSTPGTDWNVLVAMQEVPPHPLDLKVPMVHFMHVSGNHFDAHINFSKTRHHPVDSLESAFADHLSEVRQADPLTTVIDSTRVLELAGITARELWLKWPADKDGKPQVGRHLVFLRRGECQELRFSIDEDMFTSLKSDLSAILKSFAPDP